MTPADIRRTIASAIRDDLAHGQPLLSGSPVNVEGRTLTEVSGRIDMASLGAFGAAQLVTVLDTRHPGLVAHLNGQAPTEITEEEIQAILDQPLATTSEMAHAIATLIRTRHAYQPTFDTI